MINLPGSKGHHYLLSEPRRFKEIVDRFYDACVYHDFSHLKWILSPDKRLIIQNFLDIGDQSILHVEDDDLYYHVFLFFHHGIEGMKGRIGQESFPYILQQTAMLLGYKTEEFVKITKEKSIHQFLMEKLMSSKPIYNTDSKHSHELLYLETKLCRKPNLCTRCAICHELALKASKEVRNQSVSTGIETDGTKTYSTF